MPNKEEKRITEQSSLYEHLEKMSVDELTAHINAENKKVALAIEQALPAINQLISAIEGQRRRAEDSSMPVAERAEDWLHSIPSRCRTPMASTVHRYKPSSLEASAALHKPENQEKTTWRMAGTSSAINISQSWISCWVSRQAALLPSCFPSCNIARRQVFLRDASSTIPTLPSPRLQIIL